MVKRKLFCLFCSVFQGGGTPFVTNSLNSSDTYIQVGTGLKYISKDKLSEFKLDYDVIDRAGYKEQTGMFTSKFRF